MTDPEWQSPSVSSSARLDDIVDRTAEGTEKILDDSDPLKPGAGDAPIFVPSVSVPAAPGAFEPAEGTTVGHEDPQHPAPLPARSRPEPDSTSESAPATSTVSAKTRPESVDESFLSPSVAPECVMQSSADFSVNLKDQPASAEPVGPQDAAPMHVEPVPVSSLPPFSSDSVTELTVSTKSVHSDDLIQTEVPVPLNTELQTTLGFAENAMDKPVAEHLEKAYSVGEKARVKPALIESSEIDNLNFVDGSPFQATVDQCVAPNRNEFKGTTLFIEETMPEQVIADMGELKISEVMRIENVHLPEDRKVEMETNNLGFISEYAGALGTDTFPLGRVVEEEESIQNTLDSIDQTIKPEDSGLNFCYGDILEVKEKNELMSSDPTINQMAVIDSNIRDAINVTDKLEEDVFQDQEASKTLCEIEESTVARTTGMLDYADLEDHVERSSEQDDKLSATDEAYFAVSQVLVVSESQACMTYATFDSYNMLEFDSSNTNEMAPKNEEITKGKIELKETSIPLQVAAVELELSDKVEDPEIKPEAPVFAESKLPINIDATSISEMNPQLLSSFAIHPNQSAQSDYLNEIINSNWTRQNFAPYHMQSTSEITSPGLTQVEMTECVFDTEIRTSPQESLDQCKPLLRTSEECVLGKSDVQDLIDTIVTAPTFIGSELVTNLSDPDCTPYVAKEKIAYALQEPLTAGSGIPELTKTQSFLEEQKAITKKGIVEETVNVSEDVLVSGKGNMLESTLDSVIGVEDNSKDLCVRLGHSELGVSEKINKLVDQSRKEESLPSKTVEETSCSTLLYQKPDVMADSSVTAMSLDVITCKEVAISKSEPILGTRGAATIGMKPVERILADYKHVEQCSLPPLSLQDETEIPPLTKNITDDVLTDLLNVREKDVPEISLCYQETSEEVLSSATISEKYAAKQSNSVLIADRGFGSQVLAEETNLTASQSVAGDVAPSLQNTFPDNYLEEFDEMKTRIDDHSENLETVQAQMKTQNDASFPINEEVTKASKEVVTKILETSVALAEVLGGKEGTIAQSISQQETDVIFPSTVGEDVSKKIFPIEALVPELLPVAESTKTSKDAAAGVEDFSVKPDKKSVVDLIYWRDIKKTGLVFGASLFLLLSMTIFSIVSVIAYLALALLSVTISFRIYRGILQAVQKSDEGHPFKACLETDIAVSDELVRKYSDVGLSHINHVITELRRLFLVEDLVDSLKFSVLMWLLTYVGALFNGLSLLIIALVAVFSIPVVYERHQAQIDHYIGIASKQIRDITAKIQTKIPGLKKKTE
ncbi:reticulon-4-like isoform X2 [Stegostoma tigrinum]|uniref:reticulon-4-like isoform X2 n=1 Tax=Stegostoma tigrinum TaxID=3053191 RepID=UPI00202ACAB8|nr:reticulon-4-like isoform X2 [Stegostoma tigrinum]